MEPNEHPLDRGSGRPDVAAPRSFPPSNKGDPPEDPVLRLLIDEVPGGATPLSLPRTPTFWKAVWRHNPAYLISAVLMILGVYTIVQPGSQAFGNLPAILATFSTFQVYELLLVGIALFLIRWRRVMDDGATLVLAESVFVVGCFIILDEVTFRNGRIGLGLCLSLVAAVLATGRLGALIVGRALGPGYAARRQQRAAWHRQQLQTSRPASAETQGATGSGRTQSLPGPAPYEGSPVPGTLPWRFASHCNHPSR